VYYTIFTFRSFPLAPFARKRAQYSKSPEIVQAEVQENLNLGRVVHLTNMGRAALADALCEGIFETYEREF